MFFSLIFSFFSLSLEMRNCYARTLSCWSSEVNLQHLRGVTACSLGGTQKQAFHSLMCGQICFNNHSPFSGDLQLKRYHLKEIRSLCWESSKASLLALLLSCGLWGNLAFPSSTPGIDIHRDQNHFSLVFSLCI